MAITVEWENVEQRIVRLNVLGSWNWDELQHALDVATAMSAERFEPVHAIIDLTGADTLPTGSLLDRGFRAQAQALAQRASLQPGRTVVVGASSWVASMYKLAQGVLGPRLGDIVFYDALPQANDFVSGTAGPARFGAAPVEAARPWG